MTAFSAGAHDHVAVSPVKIYPFEPDWTIHPGAILKEEMAARRWTHQYLADKLGMSKSMVNNIAQGRHGYSAETALKLGETFGNSGEFWWRLWTNHQLALAQGKTDVTHG